MVINISKLPGFSDNKLYLDYISGSGAATDFFTHPPGAFEAALIARRDYPYPRGQIARALHAYNAHLGAHPRALCNATAIGAPDTFAVIAGQQAGFLGGPAYTAYKIATTVRLAAYLERQFGTRFVPIFWLAGEDHDLDEINHAYFIRDDGEVGHVRFEWAGRGRPVEAMPITAQVRRAFAEYMAHLPDGARRERCARLLAFQSGDDYCTWNARIWSRLFSSYGLVIVEPRVLRPMGGEFLRRALEHDREIHHRLDKVAERLRAAGYEPTLPSHAGRPYTFDGAGRRVRVQEPTAHVVTAYAHPERYSTDAALRPLFADAMLPVVADVLGPGETAYHAMLKPLYELFAIPQPLIFPRRSYTFISAHDAERLALYRVDVEQVLTGRVDTDEAFAALMPPHERAQFDRARRGIADALAPLRPYLEDLDPGLGKTWAQTLAGAMRSLDKLQKRAMRAKMSRAGLSRRELRALQNLILPRGRLQERVLPLAHFLCRHGRHFMDAILADWEPTEHVHRAIEL